MPLRLRRGGESTWVAATAEARGGDLVVTLRGRASVRNDCRDCALGLRAVGDDGAAGGR